MNETNIDAHPTMKGST